jgi:YVTN family beta-propeller protein
VAATRTRPGFRLLGPVEVAGSQTLSGVKQRTLLAYLLLHAGQVVPTERLVDAVWGDRAPPTATAIVHAYVRKLRATLADTPGELVTRAPGYVLELEENELDVRVFERLAGAGREALHAGKVEAARAKLAEALELWRGEPLADLPGEGFVAEERARLEQVHSEAVVDRVDAALAVGAAGELVADLEALVREQPFQERPRRQLMIALYRSGRQADALALYRQTRSLFVDELGIEPSKALQELEQAMLRQDEALNVYDRGPRPAEPGRATLRPHPRAKRKAPLLVAAACAAAAATLLVSLPHSAGSASVAPDSLAVFDPAGDGFVGDVPLGKAPTQVAFDHGAAWALNEHGRVVSRIDAQALRVENNIPVPVAVNALAADRRWLWLAAAGTGRIFRIDAAYNRLEQRSARACDGCGAALVAAAGSVWTTNDFTSLVRVQPDTLTAVRAPAELARGAHSVAVGAGAVWVGGDGVTRIDPSTLLPEGLPIPVGRVEAIAVGAGSVWVTVGARAVKIDPSDDSVAASVPVGSNPSSIAVGGGAVWVANSSDGTVSKIDPAKAVVLDTIRVGRSPVALAFGGGRLWISAQ